jgi:Flp pilus assembly protein TadD
VPTFTDDLRAALDALADGHAHQVTRHARLAREGAIGHDLRTQAEAEILLGDVAFGHGELDSARAHYGSAAILLEARQDQPAVGSLLTAMGRLDLLSGHPAQSLAPLRSASSKLPGDPTVRAELTRALAEAGRGRVGTTAPGRRGRSANG